MAKTVDDVKVEWAAGKVRLTITERTRWGVANRTRHTFRLAQFQRALEDAGIVVPWNRVKPE